jgi:hypothetical protein
LRLCQQQAYKQTSKQANKQTSTGNASTGNASKVLRNGNNDKSEQVDRAMQDLQGF